MNILVTGGTGFLGTALSRRLRESGFAVTSLGSRDADLTRADALDCFAGPFDQIYHLAAWTQAGDFCLYHPGEQWLRNQQINTNVLAWWQARQPRAKLIAMGTSCAYPCDRPLSEENYLEGLPTESLFAYAMTKRMLYAGLLALNKQYGLKYLCLVPSTLYGPGYHTDGRQMHFVFDLIRKIMLGKMYDAPVVLWGDGLQKRELVYLDDFTAAACRLAETVDNAIINLGAGEEHTIRRFAESICQIVGYPFEKVRFDAARYVGATSKCLRIDILRGYIPEAFPTALADGLARTVAWFRENAAVVLRPPERCEAA